MSSVTSKIRTKVEETKTKVKNTKSTAEKNPYATPYRPLARLEHGKYYHALAILLSIIAFVLLIVSYLYTASTSTNTPGGELSSMPWLLHINQTADSAIGLEGSAGARTLRSWGLGPFGWCEWNLNGEDMKLPGKCVRPGAWILPGSAEKGDSILAVDMPDALAKFLSPISHLLSLATLLTLTYALLLCWAMYKPPSTGFIDDTKDNERYIVIHPKHPRAKRTGMYHFIRGNKGRAIIGVAGLIVLVLLIIISVGQYQINRGDQNLVATLGLGGKLSVHVNLTW